MYKEKYILNENRYSFNRVFSYVIFSLLSMVYIMNIYDFDYNFITWMFMVLIPIMIIPIFFSKDIMHPFNFFLMSTQFLFLFNMIDLHANKGYFRYGNLQQNYYNTAFAYSILVIAIWYISMYLGFFSAKHLKFANSSAHTVNEVNNPKVIAFILFFIAALSFIFTIFLKGGISGMVLALSGRTEAYAGLSYMIKLVGLSTIAALMILCIGYKKLSVVMIIASFLMLSLFGGRGAAFFGTIFPYLMCYHYKVKKLKPVKLVTIGILAIFFGIGLGNYRLYQEARLDINGTYDMISNIANSTQGGEILPSLVGSLIKGEVEYTYGFTLLNIIFAPIPRSIWHNKPIINETGVVGYALMGSDAWGLPPGPYGIAFFYFGFIGVFLIAFITGLIVYKMYKNYVVDSEKLSKNSTGLIFYLLILMSVFNVISTSAQINIIWYIGVFKVIKLLDNVVSTLHTRSRNKINNVV